MMLSWNEIKHRAIGFSRDWKGTTSEKSERQTFWNDFFDVFGIKRRAVAAFEEPVKKLSGNWGYIDLFWPGRVLVEHKSAGQDLDKAHAQGMDYIRGLMDSGRAKEVPRWLIVSDFNRIALHDLEAEQDPDLPLFKRIPPSIDFPLKDLHKHVRRFAFIPGYKQYKLNPEDPANIEAAQIMADLHDALKKGGFAGHDLRVLLVRLLFCLFADDTGIFNQQDFKLFLENRTAADGSDTGPKLARLFEVLNTPDGSVRGSKNERQANLDEDLAAFPYVNGALFAERIAFADFNAGMRQQLLDACAFEWARISPAVFGSLFQGVMVPAERRQIGAHYTSEKDILKLIRSLFLDTLRAEFAAASADKSTRRTARLEALQIKLGSLKFLDPACGCGNFLVITYRELRALELEILLELHTGQQRLTADEVESLSMIDVDQMHGIEIEEFPTRIAEVALWLTDHQSNIALSEAFGQLYRRIPLRKSPHIVCANALQMDWKTLLAPEQCSYVLGNPPFVGHHYQSSAQKLDQRLVMANISAAGVIDFVANWHLKAAEYIKGTEVKVAFVSTNSICQGEQAGLLWSELFGRYGVKIHFAHRTFAWESEARGKAHVHCIIVGFANYDIESKILYDYDSDPHSPTVSAVRNISAYLVEGSDTCLPNRSAPICAVPPMRWGSKATDGGNFIFTEIEKDAFLQTEPGAEKFIRKYYSAEDFIHGQCRWCLWLQQISPGEINQLPRVKQRVEAVRDFRLASKAEATRNYAKFPTLFRQIAQPATAYLLIPRVSSERRPYIPIGFVPETAIAGDVQLIEQATVYHFGVLASSMHMAWVRQFCGRLKSDFRYTKDIVYNNYPWPETATDAQRANVEAAAQAVLEARQQFPASTLADLYDPLSMPPKLAKAHEQLDRAVEKCYRKDPFTSDRQRVEFLFALYETLTAPLVAKPEKTPKRIEKRGGEP
ncbi:MAG: DNA methyltransferase [Verrucomicrobiota bacterium]